jgi:K+-transporting ATPase KdpF subunit
LYLDNGCPANKRGSHIDAEHILMSIELIFGAVITVLLLAYLIYAMLYPERF